MEVFLSFSIGWNQFGVSKIEKLRPLTSILDLVSNSKKAQNRFKGPATGRGMVEPEAVHTERHERHTFCIDAGGICKLWDLDFSCQ